MKRIITGHFGSGKTEISMQMARASAAAGRAAVLVDLDVVNPYFTSSAHRCALEAAGVRVVAPVFANTNVDNPALTAGVRAALIDPFGDVVVDLGGDSVGAAVMGSLAGLLDEKAGYEFLMVVNVYRPFTQTPERIIAQMETIEQRARIQITGWINNANLLEETRPEHLYRGDAVLREVSALTDRPIIYHCGWASLLHDCTRPLSGQPLLIHKER